MKGDRLRSETVFPPRRDERAITRRFEVGAKGSSFGSALNVVVLASFLVFCPLFIHVCDVRADTAQKPDLVVAYPPKALTDIDPKDAVAAFRIYVDELAKQVGGYRGGSFAYDDIDTVMKEVENGRVDLVSMSSVQYLRLQNKSLVELAYGQARGGKATLKYLILTHANKGYTKIADLRGKKLVLLKGDETGTLYLDTVLLKQRLGEAKDFFSSVDVKIKTSQAVLSVFFGQADACVANDVAYQTMIEMNPQLGKDLKVLVSSPELLDYLAVFRRSLASEIKQKTHEVAEGLKTHPRGRQILMLFKIEDLVPLKETDLSGIRELLSEHDRLKAMR